MPFDPSTEPPKVAAPAARPSGARESLLERPTLSAEEKLSGDMLMLTTGLHGARRGPVARRLLEHGPPVLDAIPLVFQALSVRTIGSTSDEERSTLFAMIQLGLILFTPFAMQWSIGNFVNSSGVSLWGLIAPVGAVTVLGTRQSMPWFFAWLFMTVMAGVFDFLLSGGPVQGSTCRRSPSSSCSTSRRSRS